MKIAFLGTRGIPNNYGGFEQFAEYISVGLVEKGHDVTVYSPHFHPYKDTSYKGVKIKHIYSPEKYMGTAGSFLYDFSCLKDALKKDSFDILYEAGYTSVIPAYLWFNIKKISRPVIITNMDGLEFKRSKFNLFVRKFLKWEEKMAVKYSRYLVADNIGIQDYYRQEYNKESTCLAYGAEIDDNYQESYLQEFNLAKNTYYLIIARMEPENNIQMIIEGYLDSKVENPLIIIGKTNTPFAKYLLKQYGFFNTIRFVGGIYDFQKINSLRYFSKGYFHGHSVGGTNPSLLEAMASECTIMAHDNRFNRTVLNGNAFYFNSVNQLRLVIKKVETSSPEIIEEMHEKNLECIRKEYSWGKLIDDYEKYFRGLMAK